MYFLKFLQRRRTGNNETQVFNTLVAVLLFLSLGSPSVAFAVLIGVSLRCGDAWEQQTRRRWWRRGLNPFSHLVFLFFPSLLPAADCSASNLCSRFGMFSFLSLWYFFPVLIFFFPFSGGGFVFLIEQFVGVPESRGCILCLSSRMPLNVFRCSHSLLFTIKFECYCLFMVFDLSSVLVIKLILCILTYSNTGANERNFAGNNLFHSYHLGDRFGIISY